MTENRYWAYIHDSEGEITEDLGEYSNVADAVDELISNMRYNEHGWYATHTARVVDHEHDGGTTIWIAGSGHSITPVGDRNPYAWDDGSPVTIDGITPPEPITCTGEPDDGCSLDASLGLCSDCGYIFHDIPRDSDNAHDNLCPEYTTATTASIR